MTDINMQIKHAVRAHDPLDSLVALVHAWSSQGISKQAIYDRLNKFQESMSESEFTEIDEENVCEILDRLCGWCVADLVLLPDEELENE